MWWGDGVFSRGYTLSFLREGLLHGRKRDADGMMACFIFFLDQGARYLHQYRVWQ